MENYQNFFRRYELKYLLSREQYEELRVLAKRRLVPDRFGISKITSLYYDTPGNTLIRYSLDHPLYKEKLRLRSYGTPKRGDDVFVELKKKYKGVVYKRRVAMPLSDAERYLAGSGRPPVPGQITEEIDAFFSFYKREGGLSPAMLLSYDREAFRSVNEGEDLRVTFDRNIAYRTGSLTLGTVAPQVLLNGEDEILMELKTGLAIPLWLCRILKSLDIRKTSFSKYGRAYQISHGLLPEQIQNKEGIYHVG